MSLLVDMMTNTLDASYADAARRRRPQVPARAAGGRPAPTLPRRALVLLLVLVLLGAVSGAAASQLRRGTSAAATARLQLLQDVRDQNAAAADLSRRAGDLRAAVAAMAAGAAGASAADRTQRATLGRLQVSTGAVAVHGQGVVLTVDDAVGATGAPALRGGDVGTGRVQDRDLQDIVNGLWAAGAEAISVNGYRLTALTAIRTAGEAILVDFRPLSPPYVVRAIGDRNGLQSGFGAGAAGGRLDALASLLHLRYAVTGADILVLAAATAPPDLRLIQPGAT